MRPINPPGRPARRRKALGKVEIDEESTLGPEFSIDEVGGILGKDGKVEALWAGLPCQFR